MGRRAKAIGMAIAMLFWIAVLVALIAHFRATPLYLAGIGLSVWSIYLGGRWYRRQGRSLLD